MPFTPLPTIFTDLCGSLDPDNSRNLELGCGDGRFLQAAGDCGLRLWGLDLVPPDRGSSAAVVGDALEPPISTGACDLVVASNLVRHLLAVTGGLRFLGSWLALLKPGGSLFVFEDEPAMEEGPAGNYRDLQDFLSRLVPEARGPLLARRDFLGLAAGDHPDLRWEHGLVRNLHGLDSAPILDLLEPGPLKRAIESEGVDPGHYWWARATA
jgi:SAM-dependent methyltransferase